MDHKYPAEADDLKEMEERIASNLLLTLIADSKCGVMFCVGALFALRDLGLLSKTRFIQGVDMGMIVVAQIMSVMHLQARKELQRPISTTQTEARFARSDAVSHRQLIDHNTDSMRVAWNAICSGPRGHFSGSTATKHHNKEQSQPQRERRSEREQSREQQREHNRTQDRVAYHTNGDVLRDHTFNPLLYKFCTQNQELMLWKTWLRRSLTTCDMSWQNASSDLFHSKSMPWYIHTMNDIDADDDYVRTSTTLERFTLQLYQVNEDGSSADDSYSVPIYAFACRDNKSKQITCFSTDPRVPVVDNSLFKICHPSSITLGAMLSQGASDCQWGFAADTPRYGSCIKQDPYGINASNAYFLKFRKKLQFDAKDRESLLINALRNRERNDNEKEDHCLLIIDGRVSADDDITKFIMQWLLTPGDRLNQTPRLVKDQVVHLGALPGTSATTQQQQNIKILLETIELASKNTGWCAEDFPLLLQCANLGHALTFYRYSTHEQRGAYNRLFVENIGDPYDILPNLYPHAVARPYTDFSFALNTSVVHMDRPTIEDVIEHDEDEKTTDSTNVEDVELDAL